MLRFWMQINYAQSEQIPFYVIQLSYNVANKMVVVVVVVVLLSLLLL